MSIAQAQKLTSPNPFGLVCSCDEQGDTNLMAVSWWTYCSNNPATIAVCLSTKSHTGSLIRVNNEFAWCIVDETLAESAFKCGTCSGRDVNKASEFGIEMTQASAISPKVVKESRLVFECKLVDIFSVGDHDMYVGEVVAVTGDETKKALFAMQGYSRLAIV